MAVLCLALTGPLLGSAPGGRPADGIDQYSKESFDKWLAAAGETEDSERAATYAAFQQFLEDEGVAGVVPAWQLFRTDASYAARCDIGPFELVPQKRWNAIVPTLRLIRDEVKTVVGRVEVHSAWRSDALNKCVNGASSSKHLAFSAVDLIAPDRSDKRGMFKDLCAMHAKVGSRNKMGLGAYYDPVKSLLGGAGRFHIDASGYRSWGYDYTSKSSGCRLLN